MFAARQDGTQDRKTLPKRQIPQLKRRHHVFGDRQVRIKRVGLEDHGEVPVRRPDRRHIPAPDIDTATAWRLKARDDPQKRRFPAARRADERQELAVLNVKVDGVENARVPKRFSDS